MTIQSLKRAANENTPGDSSRLSAAAEMMSAFSDAGLAFVPALPHAAMIAAGARAGGVDAATARRIYLAMLAAEDDDENDVENDGDLGDHAEAR